MRKPGFGLVAVLLAAVMAGTAIASNHNIVKVSGDTAAGENQPGWLFNRDQSTSTPFEFNTDAASIGTGSLYVLPIGTTPDDKFIGEFFMLSPLGDVNEISYDFLIGAGGDASDANHFYMNVYLNFGKSDPDKFYDCRYDIVPDSGSTASFTTVTFDPDDSYPVTQRGSSPAACPSTPADMGPNATLRALSLNVGDTSDDDQGLDGYLDNVVVDLADGTTVYDFELPPTTKAQCMQGGWQDYDFSNQGLCIRFVNTGKDSR